MEGHTIPTARTLEMWEKIITATGSQRVLEIGFNYGHTTEILLELGCEVHSVEILEEKRELLETFKKKWKTFSYTIIDSRHMKPGNFDLVFIDGEHTAPAIMSDLTLAHRSRAKYIALDDYGTDPWFYWIPDVITKVRSLGFPFKLQEVYSYDAVNGENKIGLLCREEK